MPRRPTSSVRPRRPRTAIGRRPLPWLACAALLLGACAGTRPPEPAPAEPEPYWSVSRTLETPGGMVTLFDPRDLDHHLADPPDWYRHDFAFVPDLDTGRFVAVLVGERVRTAVRVTSAPLSEREHAVAGARATMRLRVVDGRLLLAGGDVWPSRDNRRAPPPHDARWLGIANGDYRVTATVLDARGTDLHDLVLRLEPVASIESVAYAPGIPRLVVGRPPEVAGLGAGGERFAERCDAVPASAPWTPLVDRMLPLPGRDGELGVSESLHERGRARQRAGGQLDFVVAREARVGTLGVHVAPAFWRAARREGPYSVERFAVRGHASCLVRVTALETSVGAAGLVLGLEPLPGPRDRLPPALEARLIERFAVWAQLGGDAAWRFKSEALRRAPDQRSLVLAVIDHLAPGPNELEKLLLESNAGRARWLVERMERTIASLGSS